MIERMYNLAVNSNSDVVVADYYVTYPKWTQRVSLANIPCEGRIFMEGLLSGIYQGFLWNKMIRRSLFVENNLSFIPGLNMWEDLTLLIKLMYFAQKIVHIPEAFYYYNVSNTGSYSNQFKTESLNNILQSVDDSQDFIIKRGIIFSNPDIFLYHKQIAKRDLIIHSRGIKQKDYCKLYPDADKVIFSNPFMPSYYKVMLYFASKGQTCLVNLTLSVIDRLKKLIRGRS
jgi:hypothetical protein